MLHIEDPFPDQMTENPLDVAIDVFFVARRNTVERLPGPEFFNDMKRCPEKVSKIFMLSRFWFSSRLRRKLRFPP